jgi:hypothetical protein
VSALAKVGLVAGGYVVAFLIASAVVAVRVANTQGPDAQAASGMYAAGDAMLFVAVFGVCALVPTGAALVFLRPYPRFWRALSTLVLAVAITGAAAAILFAVGRHDTTGIIGALGALSVLRILAAPVFVLAFLVCTALCPYRSSRIACLVATVLEAAVSAYGGIIWFLPLLLQRLLP